MAEVAVKDRKGALALAAAAALVGAGLWVARKPARPGVKAPGDPITATIRFRHRGLGQDLWVGFGYARAKALGHGDITEFTYVDFTVPEEEEWQKKEVKVQGEVPGVPPGKYDLFVFLQAKGGTLSASGEDFILSRWYDSWLTVE